MKTVAAALALVLAALGVAAAEGATRSHASADPTKFLCVFSKSVSVGGRTESTPTVCVPSP